MTKLRDGLVRLLGAGEDKLTPSDLATCIICVAVAISAVVVFVG